MPQIVTEEFKGLRGSDVPQLFSQTRDFGFRCERGKLVHKKLTGPKGYTVVEVVSTGHEARFVEQNRIAFTLPLAGRAEVRIAGRVFVTRPGDVFAIGPSERRSNLIPESEAGRYRSFTIISPPNIGILGAERCLHRFDLRTCQGLKFLIQFAFRLLRDNQQISAQRLALVEALIEELFLEALHRPGDGLDAKARVHRYEWMVRAAQTYIDAYSNEPLSIPGIASALGVGTRTLQVAFQNRCGTTPKQFLTEARLRALRFRLQCPVPATTVASAAVASGILHVGRGIDAYRKRYGELPTDTLRRTSALADTQYGRETQRTAADDWNT